MTYFSPKSEFSWSLSRYTLFKQCKRAYFFHYYASWEGWLAEADQFKKLVYRLKQIKTEKEWIDELLLESMAKAVRKEIVPNIQSVKSYCFKKAYAQLLSMQNNDFIYDPKMLCLFNRYYLNEGISVIKNRVSERLKDIFEGLNCKPISTLLIKKNLDFISSNELVKFNLGSIPVWCKTNFIYHDEDGIAINNFRFNAFDCDEYWAFSGAISFIYALKNLLRYNKRLEPVSTFVYEKGVLPVYSTLNAKEAAEIILTSVEDMMSYNDSQIDNFPKSSDKEKCRTCNFYEACAATV